VRDPGRAEASDCDVDPDVSRAETLPARAFTEPAFLALELRTLVARAWRLAPPVLDDGRSLPEVMPDAHGPAEFHTLQKRAHDFGTRLRVGVS
jgi:hypothetical protein